MSDIAAFNGTVELLKEQAGKCNVSQKLLFCKHMIRNIFSITLYIRMYAPAVFKDPVYMSGR